MLNDNNAKTPVANLQFVDGEEAPAGPAASGPAVLQAALAGVQAAPAAPQQAERAAQLPDARPGHAEAGAQPAAAAEPQLQRLRGAAHQVRPFIFHFLCNSHNLHLHPF